MRGRIRTVKPDVFHDEKLWALGEATGMPVYQGFQGLWCYADREGRFEWRPLALKSLILPYWSGDFEALLDALAASGMVVRYTVDGRDYGLVVNLGKHQAFNAREPASTLPPPPRTCAHVHARGEWIGNGNGTDLFCPRDEHEPGAVEADAEPELGGELEKEGVTPPAPEPEREAPPESVAAPAPPALARRPRRPRATGRGWRCFPAGWAWSSATAAAAAAASVTAAELQSHVDYWSAPREWAGTITDLDAALVKALPGIIERRRNGSTARAAPPPAPDPYAFAPTADHRAFVRERGLESGLAVVVAAYRAGGRLREVTSTLQANTDFAARLRCWAATGEFIATGPLPRSRRPAERGERERGAA